MYYAAIDLLAILILLIENQDIIFNGSKALKSKAWMMYRRFLFAVLAYYIVDTLWEFSNTISFPRFFLSIPPFTL